MPDRFCDQGANWQQVEEKGQQNAGMGRAYGIQRHRAGNGPGDQRGNDHSGVFQVGSHGFRIGFRIHAQLLGQHDGQGLVAGDHDCEDGSDQNTAERQNFVAQPGKTAPETSQQAGAVEHTGIAGGKADDAEYLHHGLDTAAGQQGGNFCLLRLITPDGNAQQLGQGSALDEESHQHTAEDADAHGDLYVNF